MNAKTMKAENGNTQHRGWLDKAAVIMAVTCGIHCLVTPLLLVALPIIGTTFWTNGNFHLWMLLLVIPTTTLAVFSGCRRHKDRTVAICAALGLIILASATATESFGASSTGATEGSAASSETAGCEACSSCALDNTSLEGESIASLALPSLSTGALLNLAGGLFLIIGHVRNFRLCRAKQCCDSVGGNC